MFIQDFQSGKIYKEGNAYILRIGRKEYSGESVSNILEQYSKYEHKKISNKKAKK